jgi:XTP/dITP diphosphohydrolase
MPAGFDRTFAEMTMDEKNPISHRGLSVKKLVEFLSQ